MNKHILQDDLSYIESNVDMSKFLGKTIMVTGATGLIGSWIVRSLLHYGKNRADAPDVLAVVRNTEKAKKVFGEFEPNIHLKYLLSDICELDKTDIKVDYIIHAASQTASKAFVQSPVETIKTAFAGTENVLKIAKDNKVESFLYLSSMEVYGYPESDEQIMENHSTNLDTTNVRTCYPESKRMCENLCVSYGCEYNVNTKIIRLTQTFGPGVMYNDGRIFAEFARCAIEGKNIILHTKGTTKRSYLYTADAVTAIFTVLLRGQNGEAYNAANENTYCSILEMAHMVSKQCASNKIKTIIEEQDNSLYGYAPVLKMNLDVSKLKMLGWHANYDLKKMYERMISSMRES